MDDAASPFPYRQDSPGVGGPAFLPPGAGARDPRRFSAGAVSEVHARVDAFAATITTTAIHFADAQGVETIDATHVQRASEALFSRPERTIIRHLGTIGGLLVGGCFSGLASMALTEIWPGLLTAASVGFGLTGSVMVTVHVIKT